MSSHSSELENIMAEGNTVNVFGVGVRFWHWITVLSIVVLAITGYFIGKPLPSAPGHASDWYIMGYIRFIHFSAGYIFAIAFIWRIYLTIIGNKEERQLFVLPVWSSKYYSSLIKQALYYSFMAKEDKHLGHNALAQTTYFLIVVLGGLYMIFTGFALYGEGLLSGSWASSMFSWVLSVHSNSLNVHIGHRLVAWIIVTFAMVTYLFNSSR